MGRIHLHLGYEQTLKKSPNQKKLLIGDSESTIITFDGCFIEIKSLDFAPALTAGAFLLSFHFISSNHLDQELSTCITHLQNKDPID